ncbi:MAG: hypothetical protein AB1710_04195 [Pseudomonadota bacterium]|jgi:hypothetical protein
MTLERKIYWAAGIVSIALLIGSFFMPGKPGSQNELPWQIEHPAPDTVRIFGLTLGSSTADDAERRFQEEAKPGMFKSPDGKLVAEVFFEQVSLGGLKAKMVATIAVPDEELKGMYERGTSIASTGSGKKITLAPADVAKIRKLPISGLTYMPGVRIEEEMFAKRFGQPAQRIKEKKSGAVHWLYPQNGLDITLGGKEKPVLQYVPPGDFNKLIQPLLAEGEVLS